MKRLKRESKNPEIQEPLLALWRDLWEISHPGEPLPERLKEPVEFGATRGGLRLNANDKAFARQVGIRFGRVKKKSS